MDIGFLGNVMRPCTLNTKWSVFSFDFVIYIVPIWISLSIVIIRKRLCAYELILVILSHNGYTYTSCQYKSSCFNVQKYLISLVCIFGQIPLGNNSNVGCGSKISIFESILESFRNCFVYSTCIDDNSFLSFKQH